MPKPYTNASAANPSRGHLPAILQKIVKGAILACLCVILVGVLILSVSAAMISENSPRITAHNADLSTLTADLAAGKYDCILVLGAGLRNENQDPSPMLEDRLIVATDLYRSVASAHVPLLMSGDHTGDYNEVAVMRRVALERGVPEADILLDPQGYSTYESLLRLRDELGYESVVIITQGYHLHRALHIARELGIEAVGVSSDLRDYHLQTRYELREMLARVKDLYVAAMPN